jgi:coenzyme PQQ synthesis protein D (PqqD)
MGDLSRFVDRGSDGKSFVTRRIAGETILVPVTGTVADLNAVYTLNDVGSFIWHLIDGRRSAQAIAEAVSAEYDVSLEQAAQDVDELLTTLEAKGLARQSAEPGRGA